MLESRIAHVADQDIEVAEALRAELRRQRGTIELIASENVVSERMASSPPGTKSCTTSSCS